MSGKSKVEIETTVDTVYSHHDRRNDDSLRHADNNRLAELGYKPEFKREFSVKDYMLSRYFALLTTEHVDDRSHRVQFLYNGSSGLRDLYIRLSACLGWSCWHGLWMVDPQSVCFNCCCLDGRDGVVHAVSFKYYKFSAILYSYHYLAQVQGYTTSLPNWRPRNMLPWLAGSLVGLTLQDK